MGLLDRLRGRDPEDDGAAAVEAPEPPLDAETRGAQLDALEQALRTLSRAMADDAHIANPGWSGRVDDLRFAANEAGRLSHEGFTRADLLDLVNQVRPLYPPGLATPPAEYAAYAEMQAQVLDAVAALRAPLATEQPPDQV
ncbi:MAG TPA: hypothetical protein VK894_07640 [Jiangellales bacterium]|nr:hypothetical protein [Jiangellales bacterium]